MNDYPELQSDADAIARRRKIAEALMAQGQAPLESMGTAGGAPIPISWTQGLAKMLQAYQGGKGLRETDAASKDLAARGESNRAEAIRKVTEAINPVPGSPMPDAALGGGPAMPPVERTREEKMRAVQDAVMSRDRTVQQFGAFQQQNMATEDARTFATENRRSDLELAANEKRDAATLAANEKRDAATLAARAKLDAATQAAADALARDKGQQTTQREIAKGAQDTQRVIAKGQQDTQRAVKQMGEKPASVLTAKDASTAQNKIMMAEVLKKQVAEARMRFEGRPGAPGVEAVKGIKGTTFGAGPLTGWIPTEGGQAFDTALDALRNTLTGLKRVPGVGSMAIYETKLDQKMVPSREGVSFESTTSQQLDEMDRLADSLIEGYSGLLGSAPATPSAGKAAPVASGGGLSPAEQKELDQLRSRFPVKR